MNGWVARHIHGSSLGGDESRAELLAMVDQLCAEARDVDARRAERLVIALHACWPQLPAVRAQLPDDRRAMMLDRLVTACISAFYEPAPTRPLGATGSRDAA